MVPTGDQTVTKQNLGHKNSPCSLVYFFLTAFMNNFLIPALKGTYHCSRITQLTMGFLKFLSMDAKFQITYLLHLKFSKKDHGQLELCPCSPMMPQSQVPGVGRGGVTQPGASPWLSFWLTCHYPSPIPLLCSFFMHNMENPYNGLLATKVIAKLKEVYW